MSLFRSAVLRRIIYALAFLMALGQLYARLHAAPPAEPGSEMETSERLH
jgi:hypothetical protein